LKWEARGNHNHKPNQNVQKISTKIRDEGPKIEAVTCRGSRAGIDARVGGRMVEQWVKKSTGLMPMFDPKQEK
jgi:hypothetical protein